MFGRLNNNNKKRSKNNKSPKQSLGDLTTIRTWQPRHLNKNVWTRDTDCTYQSGYGIKEVLKHSNKVVSPYKTNPFGFCNEKVVLLGEMLFLRGAI